MKRMLYLLTAFLFITSTSHAVEIKNAIIKQEGDTLTLTYNLLGKPGEKNASIKTALVIGGERYTPDKLSIKGDFGGNIAVGLRKKIVWNTIKDMPAGYQGDLTWEIDADAELYDPFNMYSKKTKVKPPLIAENYISDPNSKLTWYRYPSKLKKTGCVEDANTMVARLNNANLGGYNDWRIPKKAEIESLVKLANAYGYAEGQSMINYLGKIGFHVTENVKIWAVDKSNSERTGSTVFVSSSQQASGNVNTRTSGSASYTAGRTSTSSRSYSPSRTSTSSGRVDYDANRSTAASGNLDYNGSTSVAKIAADSGLYDVYLDSSTGYFMKQMKNQLISILPVRGDGATEILAVKITDKVNIIPQ